MIERDKKIIDLYLNHPEVSNKDIAQQFNVSISTISRIARINNLPRRTGQSGTRLTQQQIKEIKKKYEQCCPLIQLQKEYNISYDRIKNITKDCIQISSAKRLNPTLQEDYFENINSSDKAYWLGWIISDGAITNQPHKSKYQLELTIQTKDEEILHLLEKDLKVKNKVYNICGYSRFSLGCKKIINDLEKLGISQNKTFTVKIPNIDKKYYSALLRGLFDGDGGFTSYFRKNGQYCQELSFCGNKSVVEWIANTMFNAIPELTKNKITKERSIYRIRWNGRKDIKLIQKYLYQNHNNHYLKRKHNLIQANTEVTN